MKKAVKNALITGGGLVGVGIVCFVVGVAVSGGFDMNSLSAGQIEYEKKTAEFTDSFSAVDIHSISHSVRLMRSADEKTKIEYYDSKDGKITYDIQRKYASADEKGKPQLSAVQHDNREWYEHFVFFNFGGPDEEKAVTVYLPGNEYDSLSLESISGDISTDLPLQIKNNAALNSTSGEINVENITAGSRSVYTSISGNVTIKNIASGDINVSAVSGEVSLENCKAKDGITAGSVSGNVTLAELSAKHTKTETVSGSVRVQKIDSPEVRINTVSGNISGSMGFGGNYDIQTISGDIEHPSSVSGAAKYTLETKSGDISLK